MKLIDLVKSPLNIRGEYIQETVADLAESIREHSLLRPLILRALENGTFEVLSGGRRKEALVLIHGQEHELEKSDYKLFKGDDFEALSLGLIDQMHTMSFSSMEIANGAAKLKELKPRISHKEIAKILWSTEARVKRVIEMLKDEDLIPDSVKGELAMSDVDGPSFTDAHWDRLKDTALDLSDTSTVKDVCDYIMTHEVPPSKVAEVVSGVLKKQAKEAGLDSPEDDKPKKEKPKDPNLIGEDTFEGYLDKQPDGSWEIRGGKKGAQPFDPHYYTNYADHPDFKVFVKAKITVKNTHREE